MAGCYERIAEVTNSESKRRHSGMQLAGTSITQP